MQVNQQEIDAVEAKLNGQHGLKAALAVAFWSVPILVLWYWLYLYDDRFAPIMLALSGAAIGIVVRFYGRGYQLSFAVMAFMAHLAVVVAAFMFGLSLGEGQSVRAFILVGLYGVGAWSAAYIGRLTIPFEQHRAFYVLTEEAPHDSSRRLRNRWFITTPLALSGCCLTLTVSLFALTGFEIFRATQSHHESRMAEREAFEARAIEVTSAHLDTLPTDDAMRHAFAFFAGQLPNKSGNRYTRYPKSDYKAKRVLSYLSEERGNVRAKFILGRLTYNENGLSLIQQAADEGDIYAKIHVASEFGCYGEPDKAKQLLNMLAKTTNDKSALDEIYSVLSVGFEQVCAEYRIPDFAQMYIR